MAASAQREEVGEALGPQLVVALDLFHPVAGGLEVTGLVPQKVEFHPVGSRFVAARKSAVRSARMRWATVQATSGLSYSRDRVWRRQTEGMI